MIAVLPRHGSVRGWAWPLAVIALGAPLVLFALLRLGPRDPVIDMQSGHFVIVSAIAVLALGLAVAVAWAAWMLPDARTFLVALGFLAMSGILLAHAAGTVPFPREGPRPAAVSTGPSTRGVASTGAYGRPDAPPPPTMRTAIARFQGIGFSARLSLVVGALFFGLAVVDLRRRLADWVVRWWWALCAVIALLVGGYDAVALLWPTRLAWIAMDSRMLSWSAAVVAWAGLGLAGWRFLQAYRLAALPLQGVMALAMALLMEAQLFMLLSTTWQASWWLYHIVMVGGFLAAVLALLHQYRTAGDLGVVVEGLFLREAVRGMAHGDPRALTGLAAAVAAKDSETQAHVERVGDLVVAVGRRLGLAGERIEALRWAGRLHDLGKIGVPTNILRKPGPLTSAEFEVMKLHSPRGWQVARRSAMLAAVAPFIRAHHERLDGTGYPDGLRGEQIPLEARIIAVADVWDALTCDRPYRRAMPPDEAAAIVWKESGTKLDARCVSALFAELAARAWAEGALHRERQAA